MANEVECAVIMHELSDCRNRRHMRDNADLCKVGMVHIIHDMSTGRTMCGYPLGSERYPFFETIPAGVSDVRGETFAGHKMCDKCRLFLLQSLEPIPSDRMWRPPEHGNWYPRGWDTEYHSGICNACHRRQRISPQQQAIYFTERRAAPGWQKLVGLWICPLCLTGKE